MKHQISMIPWEQTFGWAYYFISILVLPSLLGLLELSSAMRNALGLGLNMVCPLFIFRRFLWKNLKQAIKKPGFLFAVSVIGFLIYEISLLLLNHVIMWLFPNHINANDQTVKQMLGQEAFWTTLSVCLFAPVSEELFYRALPFHAISSKNRIAAWAFSVFLFSLAHVIGYVGSISWSTFLLCFVQYVPAGLCLLWAMESSGNIFTPILMHMMVNLFAILASR